MSDYEYEQSYIGTKKSQFKDLFGVKADENLDMFLKYISDLTNRRLISELSNLNGELDKYNESRANN